VASRLALVTGGCRRIGGAIAARLAREGHDLAIHGSGDPEDALAAALADTGVAWHRFEADLADPTAVDGLFADATAQFGRAPDILVNNASRFEHDTPETIGHAALAAHQAVNVAAPAVLARHVAAAARADRPAVVVNILDQRIAEPNGDQLSYTLSKLALADLTRILARSFAPHTRVTGVAPGLTLPTGEYREGQMERVAGTMPLHRLATPAEIADAVAWLVAAPSVTGQILFVDGGAHLCRYERDFLFMEP
jgi:NAD(P)-dependent dehydrogenase (short-subunit alcohol dehydrogenase family)